MEAVDRHTRCWRVIYGIRKRSRENGLPRDIETPKDLFWPSHCPVLGMPLDHRTRDYSASVDRHDPSEGYTIANCYVISNRANRIKDNSSAAELEAAAMLIESQRSRVSMRNKGSPHELRLLADYIRDPEAYFNAQWHRDGGVSLYEPHPTEYCRSRRRRKADNGLPDPDQIVLNAGVAPQTGVALHRFVSNLWSSEQSLRQFRNRIGRSGGVEAPPGWSKADITVVGSDRLHTVQYDPERHDLDSVLALADGEVTSIQPARAASPQELALSVGFYTLHQAGLAAVCAEAGETRWDTPKKVDKRKGRRTPMTPPVPADWPYWTVKAPEISRKRIEGRTPPHWGPADIASVLGVSAVEAERDNDPCPQPFAA